MTRKAFVMRLLHIRPCSLRRPCLAQILGLSTLSTQSYSSSREVRAETASVYEQSRPSEPHLPTKLPRLSASWLSGSWSHFRPEQVLNEAPQVVPDEASSLQYNEALFLVTPRLAYLFSPGSSFHADLVAKLWPPPKQFSAAEASRRSIVAVVDALPCRAINMTAPLPEIHGYEGVAVCVSDRFTTSSAIHSRVGSYEQPLISFCYDDRNEKIFKQRILVRYKAAIANTIFVNGHPNTVFEQRWQRTSQDGPGWKEVSDGRNTLQEIEVPLYENYRAKLPGTLMARLRSITKPKTIASSMGNIIRQIKTSDGKVLAASHDLEAIVPPFVAAMQGEMPGCEVRVWAFVCPPNAKGLRLDLFDADVESALKRSPKQHLSLLTGSRLYRVTSGGAGWGQKAGLLSLEPATDLDSGTDDTNSMFPSFDFADNDIRMPGSADLFPPGYTIEFLVSWHDPQGENKHAQALQPSKHADWNNASYYDAQRRQIFCIGTTVLPETFVPVSAQQSVGGASETTEEGELLGTVFQPNQFGFLSTGPMSISVEYVNAEKISEDAIGGVSTQSEVSMNGGTKHHSTLFGAPNSYLVAAFRAGEQKSSVKLTSGSEATKADVSEKEKMSQANLTPDSTASRTTQNSGPARKLKDAFPVRPVGTGFKKIGLYDVPILKVPGVNVIRYMSPDRGHAPAADQGKARDIVPNDAEPPVIKIKHFDPVPLIRCNASSHQPMRKKPMSRQEA